MRSKKKWLIGELHTDMAMSTTTNFTIKKIKSNENGLMNNEAHIIK